MNEIEMKYHTQVASLLIDIESTMRNSELWSDQRPSDAALMSQEPFCIDTLSFNQWLQFVFIEKMNALISARQQLPEKCDIAPMAEEYFGQTDLYPNELIALLKKIDQLITQA